MDLQISLSFMQPSSLAVSRPVSFVNVPILVSADFINTILLLFQTLLRYGANPDLRDEDGKTPLDKARERGDEGHREVIQILQSPGEWMVALNRDQTTDKPPAASDAPPSSAAAPAVAVEAVQPSHTSTSRGQSEEGACSKKEEESVEEKEVASEPKGDPEMAPVYLQRLLPIFTTLYQSTMLPSVRYVDISTYC